MLSPRRVSFRGRSASSPLSLTSRQGGRDGRWCPGRGRRSGSSRGRGRGRSRRGGRRSPGRAAPARSQPGGRSRTGVVSTRTNGVRGCRRRAAARARPGGRAGTCRCRPISSAAASAISRALSVQAGGDRGQGRGGHRPRRLLGRIARDHLGVAHGVAGPETGQAPGLGQRPEHDQAGHRAGDHGLRLARDRVHERLVDHHDPAGPEQGCGARPAGCSDAGRVGRVADHDQVGVVGNLGRIEREAGVGGQDHPLGSVPGGEQRRLGLGELRVDDHGPLRVQGPGQQGEGLGPAGRRQHRLRGYARGRRRWPRPPRPSAGRRPAAGWPR